MTEQRVADADMRRDRAADPRGQQDRAEEGGARPGIKRGAGEQQPAEPRPEAGVAGPAELHRSLADDSQPRNLDARLEQQKGDDEAAQHAAGEQSRTEERRVGPERVRTCRSRWWP